MTEETCNICREDFSKENLINICSQCKGSDGWTCRVCLEGWIKSKTDSLNKTSELTCLICGRESPLWTDYKAVKQRCNYLVRVLETWYMVQELWLKMCINDILKHGSQLTLMVMLTPMCFLYSSCSNGLFIINDIVVILHISYLIVTVPFIGYSLVPLLKNDKHNIIEVIRWILCTVRNIMLVWLVYFVTHSLVGQIYASTDLSYMDSMFFTLILGVVIIMGYIMFLARIFDILACWKISGHQKLVEFKEYWRYVERKIR